MRGMQKTVTTVTNTKIYPTLPRLAALQTGKNLEGNMLTISIDPILFSFGHFQLRWYGLIVATAMLIGVWLAVREAGRKGFDTEDISNKVLWIVAAGLIGARLFHVIDHWPDEFAANPMRSLYIWEGGLAIWGGVLGGLVAVSILARVKHWQLPRLIGRMAYPSIR